MNEFSSKIIIESIPRVSKSQKEDFIKSLSSKYQCNIQQNKSGSLKNIIIGDINTAKVIYTTNYDVPRFPNSENIPFPESKLIHFITFSAKIILILCVFFIPISIFFLDVNFGNLYFLICFLPIFLFGKPQTHNNANTSGVCGLIELIDKMDEEDKKNCAFVFFDLKESRRKGSKLFHKEYKNKISDKLFINLDGIGIGDSILFTYNKTNNNYVDKLNPFFEKINGLNLVKKEKFRRYNSDHSSFEKGICISVATKIKFIGYFICKINKIPNLVESYTNNIEKITTALCEYQKGLNDN